MDSISNPGAGSVAFRCPYCGQTERHPAGRKLPEMCGQCQFDRDSGPSGAAVPKRPRQIEVPAKTVDRQYVTADCGLDPWNELREDEERDRRILARQRWRERKGPVAWVIVVFGAALLIGWNVPELRRAVDVSKIARTAVAVVPAVAPVDAERAAVGQWLRENWDSADWQEVKWWPAMDLRAKRAAEIEKLQAELRAADGEIRGWGEYIAGFESIGSDATQAKRSANRQLSTLESRQKHIRGAITHFESYPDRIVRIRIRTTNGTSRLDDLAFGINPDGSVFRVNVHWTDTVCEFAGMTGFRR